MRETEEIWEIHEIWEILKILGIQDSREILCVQEHLDYIQIICEIREIRLTVKTKAIFQGGDFSNQLQFAKRAPGEDPATEFIELPEFSEFSEFAESLECPEFPEFREFSESHEFPESSEFPQLPAFFEFSEFPKFTDFCEPT